MVADRHDLVFHSGDGEFWSFSYNSPKGGVLAGLESVPVLLRLGDFYYLILLKEHFFSFFFY